MSTITIRNIGPIIDVTLELNKVTVIMGPQSSGKSTIAKIISFCLWLDKKHEQNSVWGMKQENNPLKILKAYHRLSDEYFSENSIIIFKGLFITWIYDKESTIYFEPINNTTYKKSKIIYIPSERNFVSAIPNLKVYNEDNDYILDFIKNWYEAKRKFNKSHSIEILQLDVSFYSIESDDNDTLLLKNGKELNLQYASSGLQSVVPLLTLYNYIIEGIFNNEELNPMSVEDYDLLQKQYLELIKIREKENQFIKPDDLSKLLDIIKLKKYTRSQLLIEEPEQNLFPETQRDLVYYMLEKMNNSGRNHELLLTTHSPYILYALNNCMLGYLVKDTMPQDEQQKLTSKKAWIDPQSVSIWEIENGKIKSIQGEDGLIENNYFDRAMKNVMDDFYAMLNYYGDEE
jgi:predicted ATP-dependent endonuclease of OLD family